jgi:heme-degrading monooxygenase HmoA
MTVTAFVQHRTADYATWRPVYDGLADFQASAGVTHKSVHRGTDDANDLMVVHRFDTKEQADAFLSSDELRAAMQEAGVQGAPRIEVFEDA